MSTNKVNAMAGIVRRIIQTPKAPSAVGAYSQAVIVDRTMYISGQIGLDPNNMEMVDGGVRAEADRALKNMGAILEAAGVSYNNVVKTTVLLDDIKNFQTVNEIYGQYFKENLPARAAYQAAALPKGAKVEIEAIAVLGEIVDRDQSKM